jgi:hypothetical protein
MNLTNLLQARMRQENSDKSPSFLVAQAGVNIAAILATIAGPFTIGALTKHNTHTGWRLFYVRCRTFPNV